MTAQIDLSIVVVCYNMQRELKRTLLTLSRDYQQGELDFRYEVIVVDNGSDVPPCLQDFEDLGLDLRILQSDVRSISPVFALNKGLAECRGKLIGTIIDAARMVSPGMLAAAVAASRTHPRPIVYTASMMLGTEPQWNARENGYDQTVEDRLLDSIDWPSDGYRLFDISCGLSNFPNALRWYFPGMETNFLFMNRDLWDEIGGYCEEFTSAGGGYASSDVFLRAGGQAGTQVIVLEGEATFHQFHGGSASTANDDALGAMKSFGSEYQRIRGKAPKLISKPYWAFRAQNPPMSRRSKKDFYRSVTSPASRYLDLLKERVLNTSGIEIEARLLALEDAVIAAKRTDLLDEARRKTRATVNRVRGARHEGLTLGFHLPESLTMIGRKRLDNLDACVNRVLDDAIAGDLIECGVWRGGASIFMAGLLAARFVTDRTVWLADSFQGLPPADPGLDGSIDCQSLNDAGLAVSLNEVQANFDALGLLNDRVRFLPGWFADTLPAAPIEKLAVLRLDGDLFSSTTDVLSNLYHKVSVGGYVIVDDFALPPCAQAVNTFREANGIVDPIQKIDSFGVFWRKSQ